MKTAADPFAEFQTLSDAGKLYCVAVDPRLPLYWYASPVDAGKHAAEIPGGKVFAQAEHRNARWQGTSAVPAVAS